MQESQDTNFILMIINIFKAHITATEASRAATASISAHETIPGQMLSTADFAASITS